MLITHIKRILVVVIVVVLQGVVTGCKHTDADIKGDLIVKAERDRNFTGVWFLVEDGTVTINGICPSEDARKNVEKTVKGVHGVKDIVSNISIAPVTITSDHLLKKSVDSVLMKYPAVEAMIKDSMVTLNGKTKDQKMSEELLSAIKKLKPKSVLYQVTTR